MTVIVDDKPALVANRLYASLQMANLRAHERRAVMKAIAVLLRLDKADMACECRELRRQLVLIRAQVDMSHGQEFYKLRTTLDVIRKLTEVDHAGG